MEGKKFDVGKNRLELIPTELIENVGQVLTFGAQKYEAENWRKFKKEDHKRLVGAAMRHLESYRKGEYFDGESGLPHLAHAATNLGFLLHLDKPIDTWKALGELIEKVVQHYGQNKPDVVVAISRGGLVPATYLAHALGVKDIVLSQGASFKGTSTRALVVDDISDSGETLINTVKELGATCMVATIFERYNTNYKPDFSGAVVNTDEWIDFPWEVKNVLADNKEI